PPPTPTLLPYTTLFRSDFMSTAMQGVPVGNFPTPSLAGYNVNPQGAVTPTPSPSPSPSPSPKPSPTPSPLPSLPTPSPSASLPRSEEHTSELQSRGHLV